MDAAVPAAGATGDRRSRVEAFPAAAACCFTLSLPAAAAAMAENPVEMACVTITLRAAASWG